jgi:hypothetical protein
MDWNPGAEIHGTSLAQISQAGRWNQSVLCKAYLTHLLASLCGWLLDSPAH